MPNRLTRAAVAALIVGAILAGCGGSPGTTATLRTTTSTQADAEQVVRNFIAAINAGDAEAAAAFVSPDFDGGVEEFISRLSCSADVRSAETQGDTVVVELEFTGQAPLATTGDECVAGSTGTFRATVRDGQISEFTGPE